VNRIDLERTQPDNETGHGEDQHHGLFFRAGPPGGSTGLLAALDRLLRLENVRAEGRITVVDGIRLHHLEAGKGPSILLLHGATGGSGNWYRLFGQLATDHRVLALDLPGFGISDALDADPPLGRQVAGLLGRWLRLLQIDRCVVVATSFGGLAALRLAQQSPERIQALVLVDAVGLGRELPLVLRLACLRPFAAAALRPSRFGIRWQFHHLMVGDGRRIPDLQVEALLEYLWQSAAAADRGRLARAFSLFANLRGQREVLRSDELANLRVPTLIVWGERDRFLPLAHARRAAALVPGAHICIIPGAGHSPNWETPDSVLASISAFLSGLEPT
jgi:monooxygenase